MTALKHFAFIAFIALSSGALAQSYPSRPVTFVVPSAPGGGTDITARTAAAAKPDGHTAIINPIAIK